MGGREGEADRGAARSQPLNQGRAGSGAGRAGLTGRPRAAAALSTSEGQVRRVEEEATLTPPGQQHPSQVVRPETDAAASGLPQIRGVYGTEGEPGASPRVTPTP